MESRTPQNSQHYLYGDVDVFGLEIFLGLVRHLGRLEEPPHLLRPPDHGSQTETPQKALQGVGCHCNVNFQVFNLKQRFPALGGEEADQPRVAASLRAQEGQADALAPQGFDRDNVSDLRDSDGSGSSGSPLQFTFDSTHLHAARRSAHQSTIRREPSSSGGLAVVASSHSDARYTRELVRECLKTKSLRPTG